MMPERFDRQERLAGFGTQGQQALMRSSALIVGAGGLGVPAAQYLAAMGIGRLGLLDGDQVELSNLHRQPLYTPEDIGDSKVHCLKERLLRQNPTTQIEVYDTFLNANNALQHLEGYDIVLDATDNLPTRYLIDDACLILGLPWVYGALHGFEGQASVFNFRGGPTYRCLYPEQPGMGEVPNCEELGTLGILPGIIGNIQALEAVKALCGLPGVLTGILWLYHSLEQEVQRIVFQRNPERRPPARLVPDDYLTPSCSSRVASLTVPAYAAIREGNVPHLLLDVREPHEFKAGHLSGAVNLPLSTLKEEIPSLESKVPLYIICESGPRSARAWELLKDRLSNPEIRWIAGGLGRYKAESR